MADKPLQGRTVLITRASGQSEEMAGLLQELGAEVICCPTIEFVPPDDWQPLDQAIAAIRGFDWIVFTSANGVRVFLQRLGERSPDGLGVIGGLTCCAIGPATAAALHKAGLRVDVIAADSRAEGALATIVDRLGGKAGLNGVKFLIPRAAAGRDLLPDELRKLGAEVEVVSAYKTVKPNLSSGEIADLFRHNTIDAVAFTSSSTVSNFAALAGSDDLAELLRGVVVGCIGPITAATAREHGLKNIVQPSVHTSAALAEVLAEAFIHLRSDG
jgi:uroporphyrinogen III methyltransferase/synthase